MPSDLNALVPGSVTVAFRKSVGGLLSSDRYAITVSLASLAIAEYGSAVGHEGSRLFRNAATATFAASADTVPTNSAVLTALASRIARDWYGWQLASMDAVLAGAIPWDDDAFCDHVEWIHQGGEANPTIATRVRRPPLNDWVEELLHVAATPAGSGSPVDPDDPSEEIWARLTGHNDKYAHSWIRVERIAPTPGTFATLSGANFQDAAGDSGESGMFSAYERNRFPNVPKDSYVKMRPWVNNTYVFDYDYDHFDAVILAELGSGVYTVREQFKPGASLVTNPRIVNAVEFNAKEDIPINTNVKVWVYRQGETLTYGFECDHRETYPPDCSACISQHVDIDITTIIGVENVTYFVFNSTTGVVSQYRWMCFDGYWCGWWDVCACEWVPWWCVDGGCTQALTEPPGATGGPYSTPTECEENCSGGTCADIPTSDLAFSLSDVTGWWTNYFTDPCLDGLTDVLTYDGPTWTFGLQCCDYITITLACSGESLADALLTVSPGDGPFSPTSYTSNSLTFDVTGTTAPPGCTPSGAYAFRIVITW